ncbi:PDDEXK-like family protein [Alishewanella tabrizica]|nr:PD-(D/E)XK nuclease family protein [Alishewanella tabrizica]
MSKLEQLLEEFRQLPPIDVAEPSIFSIGSKGYYENPTTDILAFFCDSNGQHMLGAIVLKALLYCLPEEYHKLDHALAGPPEREVTTKTGKRIDLLVEGTNWVMLIENKIYHQQNNPFSDYENFVKEKQKTRFNSKAAIFVVLSPTGEKPPSGWHGISYPALISAIKVQLAEQFISQPINKWSLLLREFILHLESLMSQPSVNKATLNFVIKNLTAIKELQQTKQQAIDEYHHHLQAKLQNKLEQDVVIRLHNWDGYPALRFALSNWKDTDSDVVLFLSGEADITTFSIYVRLRNGLDERRADSLILNGLSAKRWLEGGKKIRGYSVKEAGMTEEEIVQFICARLLELDQLEQDNHLTTG